MRCPFCGNDDTQVKDSRPTEDNSAIRRRRSCPACGSRFTTFERVQLRELTVIKKDGQRVPFDRDKLTRSIELAVRKRPIEPERIERMVNGIVRRLESSGESDISSNAIGELVMDALANLDPDCGLSRWSQGFSVGHDWLEEAWEASVQAEVDEDLDWQLGGCMAVLCFFSSREMAQALHAEFRTDARSLEERARVMLEADVATQSPRDVDVLDLDAAMEALARFDERKSRVAELKFFGGLTAQEIATVLGIGDATVERDWVLARGWLNRRMQPPEQRDSKT